MTSPADSYVAPPPGILDQVAALHRATVGADKEATPDPALEGDALPESFFPFMGESSPFGPARGGPRNGGSFTSGGGSTSGAGLSTLGDRPSTACALRSGGAGYSDARRGATSDGGASAAGASASDAVWAAMSDAGTSAVGGRAGGAAAGVAAGDASATGAARKEVAAGRAASEVSNGRASTEQRAASNGARAARVSGATPAEFGRVSPDTRGALDGPLLQL